MGKILVNLLMSALAIFAPVKAVLIATAVLVAADLILGIIASVKQGIPVTSAGLRRTISKLLVYEAAVMLGFLSESYLTGSMIPLSKIISAYIGLTEITSIVENLNIINGSSIFNGLLSKLGSENDKIT